MEAVDWNKWIRARVPRIVDISVSEIRTQCYRRKNCHKIVSAKPFGLGRARRSHTFMAVVDVGGRTLNVELTGSGFDYRSWFESMADEPGVEVVVTDDSTDSSVPVSESGLFRQQCMVHMKRTLRRVRARVSKQTSIRYEKLLDWLSEMVKQFPSDGARRPIGWSADRRLPDEQRWLVTHLLVRWRELTLHQRHAGVSNSANWLEGRFGRIKPRYKTTRGLKTDSDALNFMAVVCYVLP